MHAASGVDAAASDHARETSLLHCLCAVVITVVPANGESNKKREIFTGKVIVLHPISTITKSFESEVAN